MWMQVLLVCNWRFAVHRIQLPRERLSKIKGKHIKRTRSSQKILWITNPILLVLNAVRIFLSLPTGTVLLERVTDFIPNFVVNLHKYISFCRLGITFQQIVLKQIKSINKLWIISCSLKSLCLPGKTLVLKSILVAYVSLNGLTRDLKTVCN